MPQARDIPVVQPGEIIQDELDARDWTQGELAEIMGRSRTTVNKIIQGRSCITPPIAQQLAAAFGTSANLWVRLDAAYQLSEHKVDTRDIIKRAKAASSKRAKAASAPRPKSKKRRVHATVA